MDELLACNPGLKSRFPTRVEFPDYSLEQLMEIAQRMARDLRMRLGTDVLEVLRGHIASAAPLQGNARDVHNLLQKVRRKRDVRVTSIEGEVSEDQLQSVTTADVEAAAAEFFGISLHK